jgi:hypothetical protein
VAGIFISPCDSKDCLTLTANSLFAANIQLITGSEAIHTRVETSSTKVICQQATGSMVQQKTGFLIMQDEKKSDESLGITPKVAEMKDLRMKQEELTQSLNCESLNVQHMNSMFSTSVLIEEPASDTDLDEHEISRQNQLSVSHGVSIISLASDDEGSLKACHSKSVSADDASHDCGYPHHISHMDDSLDTESQKGKLFDVASCCVQNEGLIEIRSVLEEGQKGKLAEKTSSSETKYDMKEAHVTCPAQDVKEGMKLELCAGEELFSVSQKPVIQPGEQVSESVPLKLQRNGDEGDDPAIEALLQRIRKQRTVLEEILEKEEERKHEGKGWCRESGKKEVRKS